jgi:dihydrofolate reductase
LPFTRALSPTEEGIKVRGMMPGYSISGPPSALIDSTTPVCYATIMIISLIAAMAENRVIGYQNAIPWNIPSDQKRFKAITMGHPTIFGRKTWEIIGRPLPGRKNIVLTRQKDYQAAGAKAVHSLDEAFAVCEDAGEVFICGGGMVFFETIPLARLIYLTVIHLPYEGDTFFPEIPAYFNEIKREEMTDTPPSSFVLFERKA